MGDRVCVMDQGKLIQVGAPMDVYRDPSDTFVARFLGSPPMNLMPGHVISTQGRVAIKVAGVEVSVAPAVLNGIAQYLDKEIIFGIRPEDLHAKSTSGATVELRAKVEAVEPLGAETLVVVSLPGVAAEVVARMGRETTARVGDPIALHLDVSSARLFDKATTRAIV